MDQFFGVFFKEDFDIRHVTKSAFCQARKNVSHTTFIDLNTLFIDQWYADATLKNWEGFRLCAIDGSKLRLPNNEAMRLHFGGVESDGGHVPMACMSECIDVTNGLILDVAIGPYKSSERVLAAQHIENSQPNDLLLYDRGYHGFYMFALHRHHSRHFCIRMPSNTYSALNEFMQSGSMDQVIKFNSTKESRKLCRNSNISHESLHLRVLKVVLSTGEVEILVTNLIDKKRYKQSCFGALYNRRWHVEEDFKRKKQSIEIENFTGLSVNCVLQDIHAKVLMHNIVLAAGICAEPELIERTEHCKYRYAINASTAVSKAKNLLVKVIHSTKKKSLQYLEKVIDLIGRTIEPIRPGRSYERRHKTHKKVFYNNFKRAR